MMNSSNALSFLRIPLALLFLIDNSLLRLITVIIAMITDGLDGYLARRYQHTTRFGAILDPISDKFFVCFILGVLFFEGHIELWQACAMLTRDAFLFLFGAYLFASNGWKTFQFRAIRWGKITTATQFFVLISLSLGYKLPSLFYALFFAFGTLAFIELFSLSKKTSIIK